ncbi:MAG: DHA2 family efflux MFS transporter permease subunit [Rhodobacteraceae bacterium]|uniref:EmrB/QacA family drug resistance transporter n=1 Tax=Thioclava marina TaxID=1915077 RepID=A0ABX3MRA8_9RHOB|nr:MULTISPECIES: DHA2 family efflux MFS transporter permease subunit [Thioclava]MBD3804555.1 DHA2 family efflux MFS transporter permease subunit [Thioclava sp.]OOY14084.1 EmrB/QacA family drug resistance transporter [Thioclava marina]OOY29789.1 EmrB/QacA family drug resistance transporter [Thioclava sp. L04-15]TNF14708.1 MAG: DHA2 family efflux MFS transporter permease subunit [Paracoccaceae bacterium]
MAEAAPTAPGEKPKGIDPHNVKHRGLIMASLMLAVIMQVLDTTIANVALPDMRADLGASRDTINWVLTSYIVAAAIVTPLSGWLANRFGRREIFMVSVVGFVIFSMLCGIAWSLDVMVIFRLMQGVFGAAIVPLAQNFMLDINPRERHGQAMAMFGAGIMLGPIIGPTLGGYLTEVMNWRWVFYINVPLGMIAIAGSALFLPETPKRKISFDFFGFAALAIGIGALQMMLDRGSDLDWFASREIWLELALAVSGFWIFLVWILGAKKPFLDPHMFLDRNLTMGLLFIFIVGIILLASLALLPPMLSGIFGYPTLTTGLVMSPRGVGAMIMMLLIGRLVKYVDLRILVVLGLSLTAYSLHMMSTFSPVMGPKWIIISGVIQGFGLGSVFVPISTLTFATLHPEYRGDGTALFSLLRNIGSSIGISIVTALLTHNIAVNHSEIVSAINPQNLQGLMSGSSALSKYGSEAGYYVLNSLASEQAAMISYLDDFRFMMWITLAAIPLVFFLRKPDYQGGSGSAPQAAPVSE